MYGTLFTLPVVLRRLSGYFILFQNPHFRINNFFPLSRIVYKTINIEKDLWDALMFVYSIPQIIFSNDIVQWHYQHYSINFFYSEEISAISAAHGTS